MTTLAESLESILVRELNSLRQELEAYPSDADLWRLVPGIANSGGTLALHLVGNLQHFIGAVLGNSGYLRNRDAEFAARDRSRAELIGLVDQTIAALQQTLRSVAPGALDQRYPEPVAKHRLDSGDFLIHLATHFGYHLGQLDYHRRIVAGGGALPGVLSPTRLRSAIPEPAV